MTSRLSLPAPWSEVLALHPAPLRYRSGLIAALCTAVPVIVGQGAGQPTLGLIASSGALAALYSRAGGGPRTQAVEVGTAAVGLVASFSVGTALAGHLWADVFGNAIWAALVTTFCALINARPPGIVMPILLASVGGGLPPGHAGERIAAVALVAMAATVLCSVAAVFGQSARAMPATSYSRGGRAAIRAARRLPASPVPLMAARVGLGVGLAGCAALSCQLERPYWAMATTGAVMARGSYAKSTKAMALLRGTGTAVGCLLAGAVAALRPDIFAIALLLGLLTFVTELVVVRNYAIAMIFVTPMSTLLVAAASHDTSVLALSGDRLVETVLGCLAATLASQLVTSRWALRQRREAVAAVLLATADLLDDPGRDERIAALHQAREHMRLVSDRTAGERRAVRATVASMDHVAQVVDEMVGRRLEQVRTSVTESPAQALVARQLAQALLRPADPEARIDDAEELSAGLATLRIKVLDWTAQIEAS